jgi:murein DD-endopeptidase MepM/ murein hydrolase activator NlpD
VSLELSMRNVASGVFGGATSFKLVLVGFAAMLLSGCSDSIERFSSNYNNPSDSDPVYTASIPKPIKRVYRAPAYQAPQVSQAEETIVQSPIAKAPLAAVPQVDYTKAYAKTYRQPTLTADNEMPVAPVAPAYAKPKYAFNKPAKTPTIQKPVDDEQVAPVATYKKPTYKAPAIADEQVADNTDETPAVVAPKTTTLKQANGATIKLGSGMTLYAIAKANHLSVRQLASANGIAAPYIVAPGRTIKVPGVRQAVVPEVATAEKSAAAQDAPAVAVADTANQHTIAKGDTLYSLGRAYKMSPFTIADANGLAHDKPLPLGKIIKIPNRGQAAAAKPVVVTPEVAVEDVPKTDQQVAASKPAPLALPKEKPAAQVADATPAAPAAATASDAQLTMRWPVRGKVISGFGAKPNGMKNEGINIAVPEGTKIQAAEAGVVAYAGNELKGYGNLVLIRHAGGYVTAYAHAASLLVKKGDQVKRGDVIATAGQTGAVQSPQVHFEVRKGATALDPNTFLNAATASK